MVSATVFGGRLTSRCSFMDLPKPFVRPFCLLYNRRTSGERSGGIEATGEIAKLATEPRSFAI
jgi:hypothetical protein